MAVKLMIVENEPLYRDLLTRVLSAHPAFNVVDTAVDAAGALQAARRAGPDVVLMDIDLGEGPTGIDAGRSIRKERPHVGIVLLSNYADKEYLGSLAPQEAAGWAYLLKTSVSDVGVLARAIEAVASGLTVVGPAVVMTLRPRPNTSLRAMTPRQQEVLGLMSQGYSNAGVAMQLGITEKSVENYINLIYRHLGIAEDDPLHPRVKAVLAFLEQSRHTYGGEV